MEHNNNNNNNNKDDEDDTILTDAASYHHNNKETFVDEELGGASVVGESATAEQDAPNGEDDEDVTSAVERGRAAAIRAATLHGSRVRLSLKPNSNGILVRTSSYVPPEDDDDDDDEDGDPEISNHSSSRSSSRSNSRSSRRTTDSKNKEKKKASATGTTVEDSWTRQTSSSSSSSKDVPKKHRGQQQQQQLLPEAQGECGGQQEPNQVTLSTARYTLLVLLAALGVVLGTMGSGVGIAALVQVKSHDNLLVANSGSKSEKNAPPQQQDSAANNGTTVQSLLHTAAERGYVKCGLVSVQPGFLFESGRVDETTGDPELVGFDVFLCSAIAAALTGDPTAYEPYTFTWGERWTMLNSTTVDLVFRSTHNMERDVFISQVETGFEFSTPYFYDGMIFAGVDEYVQCAEALRTNGTTCADLKVCVADGTTTIEIVREWFPPEHVLGITEAVSAAGDFLGHFPHDCNVIASEQVQASEQTLRQQGYTGPYTVGTEVFSKEPLCMVTRENDPLWTDFVETVLQALLYAETEGITQVTAASMPTTHLFGERFTNMYRHAVAAHGNYGQLYNTNFENFMARSGQNLLETDGLGAPKIWAFPYGPLTVPNPRDLELASPTVRAIKQRGYLNCGTAANVPGFSALHADTLKFEGFDIDLCRAVSAALFDGVVEHTVFTNADADRQWLLLQEERVDLLAVSSTISVGRNVKEVTTAHGFTFTDAFLFFSYSFGGLPEYVPCAENGDVVSAACQGLRVCVASAFARDDLRARLGGRDFYIMEKDSPSALVRGLRDGECNVIYDHNVRAAHVRAQHDYDKPYVEGSRRFFLEPTGIVTRQEDPLWSDFVYWVLSSLVYAEEEGITRDTAADRMPRSNLFGPYRSDAFVHAVRAVGNYGDIYARHLESIFPRGEGSVNQLNRNNQPRMYGIPGFQQNDSS